MREFLNYKLWSDISIGDFFTFIGILAIILYVIDSLIKYIPFFQKLKVSTLDKAADIIKLRAIKKRAVSSGIELMLNQTVNELRNELPKGWINRASIKWVGKTLPPDFQDKQLIMRIRPTDNNDYNYLNAIYYFFSNSLFPESCTILPASIKESSSLYMVKRTIEDNQPYLTENFKKHFLSAISKDEPTTAGYYGDYLRIDEYGFFSSAFLREVDTLANSLQFSRERQNIENEINNILNHLIKFEKLNKLNIVMGNDEWYKILNATSYGLILVAKPEEKRLAGIEPYVKRAKQRLRLGIKRLYILGCHAEQSFFNSVILAIKDEIREYKLQETFKLYRDYRGEANGIGALFIIDTVREGLLKNRVDIDADDVDNEEEFEVGSELEISSSTPPTSVSTESETTVILSETQLTTEIISVMQTLPQQEGWVFLGAIGGKLKTKLPLFNQHHYGCSTLRQLFIKLNAFDLKEIGDGTAKAIYVRIKSEPSVNKKADSSPQITKQLDEKEKIILYLTSIVSELADEDGWSYLGIVGSRIKKDYPNFDPVKFGSSNLRHLCEDSQMFEVRKEGLGPFKSIYIKVKDTADSPAGENQSIVVSKDVLVAALADIVSRKSNGKGWIHLATIGWDIKKLYPNFDTQQYNSPSLRHFLESTGRFEMKQEGIVVFVKLKA